MLHKILKAGDPVDLKLWTKSGEIQEWRNCIPLRYNFYKGTQQIKLLVYATKPVINQQTPIEWWTIASNYVLLGAIPHEIDQIENAVVGFVCCEGEPICRFSKCHAFDTPIKATPESLTNEMVDLLIDT